MHTITTNFHKFIFLFTILFLAISGYATETADSVYSKMNIPCIIISTIDNEEPTAEWIYAPEGYSGKTLANNNYVNGKMIIKMQDCVYYDSKEFVSDESGMRIKLRGNSSALWKKKSYKIKLSKKSDLFFRDDNKYKSKEWLLLNCPKIDLNTLVGFKVSELLEMEWTPKCRFVNLIINNDYRGLYVLIESVEKDRGRLDISDNGFIIEDNAYWWSEEVYFKGIMLPDNEGYTLKYPDPEKVSKATINRIWDYILEVENKLIAYEDISKYIDIESFARWLLVHDILGTEDGRGSNRFFYRESMDANSSSLLKIGPVWDFDDIFKRIDNWSQQHSGNYRFYYKYLLKYDSFNDTFYNLWYKIKDTLYKDIEYFLDNMYTEYGEELEYCRVQDSKRWNRRNYNSLEEEIDLVKEWFADRIAWINSTLPNSIENIHESQEQNTNNDIWLLDGRKVKSEDILSPGIYIINGQKKLIKKQ